MGAATPRIESAETFPTDPAPSLACLNAAIDSYCARTATPRKRLAEESLHVSAGEFSKLCAGKLRVEQFDLLPLEVRVTWRDLLARHDAEQGVTTIDVVLRRLQHDLIDSLERVTALPVPPGKARPDIVIRRLQHALVEALSYLTAQRLARGPR
jgi:hypothetical protein